LLGQRKGQNARLTFHLSKYLWTKLTNYLTKHVLSSHFDIYVFVKNKGAMFEFRIIEVLMQNSHSGQCKETQTLGRIKCPLSTFRSILSCKGLTQSSPPNLRVSILVILSTPERTQKKATGAFRKGLGITGARNFGIWVSALWSGGGNVLCLWDVPLAP
jgi:hypothetical protein